MSAQDAAPDAVGPVLGVRIWRLDVRKRHSPRYRRSRPNDHFGELKPLNARHLHLGWPGWRRLEAECKAQEPHEPHAAPAPACRCGIYASKTIGQVEEPLLFLLADEFWQFANHMPYNRRRETWIAAGAVALWGKTIEGTRGYRAQYAYPASLWILPPAVFGSDDLAPAAELMGDLIHALRSRYGVAVGYAGHSPEWNALITRPSVGPFFSWRLHRGGGDTLAEAVGELALPSDKLPTVSDALARFSGTSGAAGPNERHVADTHLTPVLGHVPLRYLGRKQIARYRAHPPRHPVRGTPYSERTVQRHLAILRAAVGESRERGWFTEAT